MTGIFMDHSRPNLLAVSAAIEADSSLTSARRGAIRSAINTLCRIMDMTPATVPAHLDFIRRKLEGISPAAAGVKEKRFSTVKSEVAFALRHLGLAGKGTHLTPMVGEWISLWRLLPDKYARTVLSRFFRYCSARDINPADVTDIITDEFRQALVEESFVKDPRVNHQNLCRVWNKMFDVVDGWPEVRLAVPRYAKHYILAADTFPPAFWQDVDAWTANQAS